MTTYVILSAALALGVGPQAKPQVPQAEPVIFTGCVVASAVREDTFELVPAESDPAKPVGTSGAAVWTVPAYRLLGGLVSAEHVNKTVEITGTLEAPGVQPARPGDTTQRAGEAGTPIAQLQVQAAKVVAATCTPKHTKGQDN